MSFMNNPFDSCILDARYHVCMLPTLPFMDWSKHLNALKCSFQLELPISWGNIDLGGILLQLGLEAICCSALEAKKTRKMWNAV